MNKLTKVLVIGVTISGLAVGATAYAKRGGGDRGARMVSHIADHLELDDSQTQALDTLRLEISETRELVGGDKQDMKAQVSALIAADTFDQGAALGMINERAAAFQANAPELVAAAGVFFDSLTVEQKTEIQGFMDRFGNRHERGDRHERGHDYDD